MVSRSLAFAVLVVAACSGGGEGAPDASAPDAGAPDDASNVNATLSALSVSVGELVPPFEPDVTEYDVSLPLADAIVAFTATAAVAAGTTITVGGEAAASGTPLDVALLAGTQDVDIDVTLSSGASTTYRVHVHRGTPEIALSLSGGAVTNPLTPAFDPATQNYAVNVGLWLREVQLTVVPVVAGSTIAVGGGAVVAGEPSLPVPLNLGLTPVSVVVTSPAGAATTYTVNITRAAQVLQQAYVKASNTSASDQFGNDAIALWGDTLVVGTQFEDSSATGVDGNRADNSAAFAGAVYVFRRSGTTWAQEAYLKASNTAAADRFGASVSLSGDTLAIGAPHEDSAATGVGGNQADNSVTDAGAVYVFTRSGTSWTQEAYLKASNPGANDSFGNALSLDGDTLAVGAFYEASAATGVGGDQTDNSIPGAGAVYAFTRSGITWSQQSYIKASNPADDSFGISLSLFGDTLAVGAWGDDSAASGVNGDATDNSLYGSGAAYVFARAGTAWSQQAYLKASNPDANDLFGNAVALWGDTLAVGAEGEDCGLVGENGGVQTNNSAPEAGAAYVFQRVDTTWSQQAYVKAYGAGANDRFGSVVALWGDTLAVGAVGEDSMATGIGGNPYDSASPSAGAVWRYTRQGNLWPNPGSTYLKASNTETVDTFGSSVALWGDTLAAGAAGEDGAATGVDGNQGDNTAADSGSVYVFR